MIPMTKPLYLNGYNSDSNTHITGPNEKAKHPIKPKIPINIKLALILVAASKIAPSFLPPTHKIATVRNTKRPQKMNLEPNL